MTGYTSALHNTAIINYGISEQLRGDFDILRETTFSSNMSISAVGHEDVHKFSRVSVDKLAQNLVCRNYGNSCYELAHLCWAILHSSTSPDKALINYFWLDTICTKASFNDYFSHCLAPNTKVLNSNISASSLRLSQDKLHIVIHQHEFTLHSGRANYLSCLMEWLACTMPNTLSILFTLLLGKGHNAISEAASTLQQHIYGYLSEHLPPAKLQQRYRLLDTWYKDTGEGINDAAILHFFQQHNHLEGCGKYTNVVNDTFSYMQALEDASTLQQVNDSEQVVEQVAEHSDAILSLAEQYGNNYESVLTTLAQSPKVFSQAQCDMALMLSQFAAYFPRFSKTWLRCQSFGKWQSKLIQASRKASIKALNQHGSENIDSYSCVQRSLAGMLATSYQAQLAMLHLFFTCSKTAHGYTQLISLLHLLSSSHPVLKGYQNDIEVIINNMHSKLSSTGNTSSDIQKLPKALHEMASKCAAAYKQINRVGFTAASKLSNDEYNVNIQDIMLIQNKLRAVLRDISRKNYCDEAIFSADRFIFEGEFTKLYVQDDQ